MKNTGVIQLACKLAFLGILSTSGAIPALAGQSGLIPQEAFLSSSKTANPYRELYIKVLNTAPRRFENKHNPISVIVNGVLYKDIAYIHGKTSLEYFRLWADIGPQEEGAIFIRFTSDTPYRDWQQCQPISITLDPEGKLPDIGSGSPKTKYTLRLRDTDYASDCRHVK